MKGGKRIDATCCCSTASVEAQLLHDGELAYGHRFTLKAGALMEAEMLRERLTRERAGRYRRPSGSATEEQRGRQLLYVAVILFCRKRF